MARPHGTKIIYEPRVLWAQVQVRPDSPARVEIKLPDENFYNGTRWPFVIQHLLLSPVGYTLRDYATVPAISPATFRNTLAAILDGVAVRVTAPGRKHFSRTTVQVGGYRPRATATPAPDTTTVPFASSLFGMSSWRFRFPHWDENGRPGKQGLVLPKDIQMDFDLSGYTFPNAGLGAPPIGAVRGGIAVFEETDEFWHGFARWSGLLPIAQKVPLTGQPADGVYPRTPAPVPPDGFGFNPAPQVGQQNLTFDKRGVFPHGKWLSQESNIGTNWDCFSGFAIMLDQIDHDLYIQQSATPGISGNPLAPLSQRVALRAQTPTAGSGAQWFFPEGAPVSLCCPTVNEVAVVHDFDDPISLDPNAGLSIDLLFPGGVTILQELFGGTYNLGVSVVGYAILET